MVSPNGASGQPPTVLSAHGVSVQFGGIAALSDVSVSVARSEICAVIGPNGAGKTTLFDVFSGIRRTTKGRVELGGNDITRRSATWRAKHGIRRTFQRQQLFGPLSVEDNIVAALDWHGGGGGFVADAVALPARRSRERERRARAAEILEICGLERVRNEPAGRLPIGMARLVELARALADRPQILLLDEPTSGLDESEAELLGRTMQRVRTEDACSIMLVEHEVGFVMGQSDRVVVLNLGQVIAEGTPEQIRHNDAARQAYFG